MTPLVRMSLSATVLTLALCADVVQRRWRVKYAPPFPSGDDVVEATEGPAVAELVREHFRRRLQQGDFRPLGAVGHVLAGIGAGALNREEPALTVDRYRAGAVRVL